MLLNKNVTSKYQNQSFVVDVFFENLLKLVNCILKIESNINMNNG
jgi:hypothetical protein